MSDETDLEQAADRLYAQPPSDFTATRDALVRQARAAGDRALATELASWRRPTVAAWLVNLLVRERPEEVRDVVALGAELREATDAMSGTELRALSAQRHRLVQTLVSQARALGRSAGARVGEEALRGVEETLHAALADPEAAHLLLGARLTQPLRHTGFAPKGAASRSGRASTVGEAGNATGSRGRATHKRPTDRAAGPRGDRDPGRDGAADRRAALEAELATEWARAREAADARDSAAEVATAAKRAADEARRDAQQLGAQVVRLREQLDQAERALAEAAQRQRDTAQRAREAAQAHQAAASGAGAARRRVSAVQRRLDSSRTRPRQRPTKG